MEERLSKLEKKLNRLVIAMSSALRDEPPELEKVLLGDNYRDLIFRYEMAAKTNAQYPLYNGQYVIEAFTNAWLATGDQIYLDKAFNFIENIIATAVDTITINSSDPNINLARPIEIMGAIDTGEPYKGWLTRSSGYLQQGQFARGIYRLCFEILNGFRAGEVTQSNLLRARSAFMWVSRNIMEKFLTSPGNSFYHILYSVERAAARTTGGSSWLGCWDDKMMFGIGHLAYMEQMYPQFGKDVPEWVSRHDWRLMAKIFMQVGPAIGPTYKERLLYGLEYHNGMAYLDRENPYIPNSTSNAQLTPKGAYGWDTGHGNRIPDFLCVLNRVNHGDELIYQAASSWLKIMEINAKAILFENNDGYIQVSQWMNGNDTLVNRPSTDSEVNSNDHLGFVFPTWQLFAVRNKLFANRLERFYQQQKEWIASGRSKLYPGYSYSLARNTTDDGLSPILSAIALSKSVKTEDIWGEI